MNFIKKLLEENKELVVNSIFDEELKQKVVKSLNDNVDIPIISEKTEEKIITAIYDSVEDVIKATIIEKL
jgi:hypothetical protein